MRVHKSPHEQRLERAELHIQPPDDNAKSFKIALHVNPSQIEVSRGLVVGDVSSANSGRGSQRIEKIKSLTVKFPKLIFDTYEQRTSVRSEVIDKLEAAVAGNYDKNRKVSIVTLNWGKFTESSHSLEYTFVIERLDITYTMFLPDGTPVRAEVALSLRQYLLTPPDAKAAKAGQEVQQRDVKKGDTLQSIAADSYGDPRQWREICRVNKIDDPMKLKPGTRLIVPPAPPLTAPTPPRVPPAPPIVARARLRLPPIWR